MWYLCKYSSGFIKFQPCSRSKIKKLRRKHITYNMNKGFINNYLIHRLFEISMKNRVVGKTEQMCLAMGIRLLV